MVATFSPHRDAGGTLHLPSPSGIHHVDASSAIRQLRRSLSRSPSKSSDFRLLPSRTQNTTPFISSPLSPSRRGNQGSLFLVPTSSNSNQSPLAIPYPPSAKISRPTMRRTGPMPASRTRTSPKSPTKRALNPLADQGNATPAPPATLAPGEENVNATPAVVTTEESSGSDETVSANASTETILPAESILGPKPTLSRVEKRRSGTFGAFSSTVSPLKRSDGIMGLDQASRGSPSAKRRSVHSASFGGEFSIFDNSSNEGGQNSTDETTDESANENDTPSGSAPSAPFSPFATIPTRSSSLRRSTLQQRQADRSLFSKPRTALDQPDSPAGSPGPAIRPRMSLDGNLFQPSGRESPFASQGTFATTSRSSLFSSNQKKDAGNVPHPLSRTITQSSSNSSLADDSPTHEPIHKAERPKAACNFSKSLPVGATRPGTGRPFTRQDSNSSTDSFATPENYKLVKPLPAAFMSTGLISKKNRNAEDVQSSLGYNKNMPDTPCKRSINLLPTGQKALPERTIEKPKLVRQSFAVPSSPFNPQTTRPSSGPFAKGMGIFGSNFNKPTLSRRSSFVSVDGDEISQSPSARHDNQSISEADLPPTPTKQAFFPSRTYPLAGTQLASLDRLSESKGSSCKFSLFGASPLSAEEDSDSIMDDSPSANLKSSYSTLPPSCHPPFRPMGNSHTPSPHSENVTSFRSAPVGHAKSCFASTASPLNDKFERASPRTPQEHILPPDPSGLSISAPHEQPLTTHEFNPAALPATPTGPREYFPQTGKRPSLSLSGYNAPDVDITLTSRFEKVELIGTGEFSQVYRVAQPQNASEYTSIFSLPPSATKSPSELPERVWAVKKSKQPYAGVKDRERRMREVDVLKALTNSDHIISFIDSWEDKGHLYIQTEFCEEGSLDVFLAQVGLKARLDDFRIWKILLELSLGLKHIHDSGFIHLDLKPANILITFEGVLKIADFGMATRWPAAEGIEGEGDREYIGPEILMGQYDKPADIFALGLIMFETAGNVELPDNGVSWQKLRNGDMSDVPSLTWSEETSIFRDASGNPVSEEPSFDDLCASDSGDEDFGDDDFLERHKSYERRVARLARSGELVDPPSFMVDANHEDALDKIVRWMISPNPADRPTADQVLQTFGVQWAERRRRAGATVYEGNWGPADEVLAEDAEMIDV